MKQSNATELQSWSLESIEARREELRYLGTQYALNGLPAPDELEQEYQSLRDELDRRDPRRASAC